MVEAGQTVVFFCSRAEAKANAPASFINQSGSDWSKHFVKMNQVNLMMK